MKPLYTLLASGSSGSKEVYFGLFPGFFCYSVIDCSALLGGVQNIHMYWKLYEKMGVASVEHKVAWAKLIKNICRKNLKGNKRQYIWEIFYMGSSCMHPFDVGNGKTFLKVSIFIHS